MSPGRQRRFRWRGQPADTQPDIGDVLYVVDPIHGLLLAPIYRVLSARELRRGPHAGTPHHLVLMVAEDSIAALDDAEVERFPVVLDRRGRRR